MSTDQGQPQGVSAPVLPTPAITGSAAGAMYHTHVVEMQRRLAQAKGNAHEATKLNLTQLETNHLILPREAEQIGRIAELVFARAHGQHSPADLPARVHSMYQTMLKDPSSSQVGLAIVGAIADALA